MTHTGSSRVLLCFAIFRFGVCVCAHVFFFFCPRHIFVFAHTPFQVAATLHEMGVSAFGAGKMRQSEVYFRRSLAIKDTAGPSLDMAYTLHNLGGVVFASGGRTSEAEGLFWRALDIREKLGASLDAANTLHCLGECARERISTGDDDGGMENDGQGGVENDGNGGVENHEDGGVENDKGGGRENHEDGGGENHEGGGGESGEGGSSGGGDGDGCGEGSGYRPESSQEGAEGFYRRALEIQEKELGGNNLVVAETLFQLGQCLFSAKDKSEEALACYARSLAVREAELGRNHEDVLLILHQLGACAAASGRIDQAEAWYGRAVVVEELTLGPDHPTVARTLHRLGACVLKAGKIDEGIATLRRALDIPENAPGVEDDRVEELGGEGHHLDVAITLQQLAVCAVDDGRTGDADALFREVLAVEEKILGADHLVSSCLYLYTAVRYRQ